MSMSYGGDPVEFRAARRAVIGLLRRRDWENSELGSPMDWPSRLQHLVEQSFDSPFPNFIICGASRSVIYNGAFAQLYGSDRADAFGRPFADAFPEAEAALSYIDEAFTGEPTVARNLSWPVVRSGQTRPRTYDLVCTPVTDEKITVSWVYVQVSRINFDTDGAEGSVDPADAHPDDSASDPQTLRQNEERFRLAIEVAKLSMWDWNIQSGDIVWSDEHFCMEGYEVGEIKPSVEAWTSRIHPDDVASTLAALDHARDNHILYKHEFRFQKPDGQIVWSSAAGRFFYNDAGEAVRMIGVMHDVTQLHAALERQQMLLTEMQHRTHNLIGLVQSIARKTLARCSSTEEFRQSFDQRMTALARVQTLLTEIDRGRPVTFSELLIAELAAHAVVIDDTGSNEKVKLIGPDDVYLWPSAVQTFALALHELATNAVKYGALRDGGQLVVRWTVDADHRHPEPILNVEWLESGVTFSAPTEKTGSGYGRELIERALPYQLGATTSFELGDDGAKCRISLPMLDAEPSTRSRH